ncbi:hypothetical protein TNCV_4853531 [Trichonephila clavipes]|nr:hypothetical protein TNCV_4853531 [Trichonephila clavipes]
MNKPISWPKRLRRCIHLVNRFFLEMPINLSGIEIREIFRDKNRQKRTPNLTQLAHCKFWSVPLDGERRAQLSIFPRIEGVACVKVITGHDFLQVHRFKIGMADSPLCPLYNSVPMTGEYLFGCPSLLHSLFQYNCGDFPPSNVSSVLYWTTRRLMLTGVIKKKDIVCPNISHLSECRLVGPSRRISYSISYTTVSFNNARFNAFGVSFHSGHHTLWSTHQCEPGRSQELIVIIA